MAATGDSMEPAGAAPPNGAFDSFYVRVFTLATIAVLIVVLLRVIAPFVRPMMWAGLLAFLLHPVQVRLVRTLRGRVSIAAGILTVFVFLLFVGPLTLLGVVFAAQAGTLADQVRRQIIELRIDSVSDVAALPALQRMLGWLEDHASISTAQAQRWMLEGATRVFEQIASLGGTVVLSAVGTVVGFGLMLFVLFFFIRDGEQMSHAAARFVPLPHERRVELVTQLTNVTRAVVLGTAVTATAQGVLLGIGFAIAGLPAPVVFGVLAGIFSVLPFGGTSFVWVPAAAFLFLQNDVGHGLFVLAWGLLLVSTIDNFLRPLFISGQANIPTLAVFIGVFGGLAAFGLVGLFVGPVVLAMALTLLRFAAETLSLPPPAHPPE
jgi:predicted PurR-regulated permease PerM